MNKPVVIGVACDLILPPPLPYGLCRRVHKPAKCLLGSGFRAAEPCRRRLSISASFPAFGRTSSARCGRNGAA